MCLIGIFLIGSERAYYWLFFVSQIVGGALLLLFISDEIFGELYWFHEGLRGATEHIY